MKVLILNSGMGSRMGVLTSEHPKCVRVGDHPSDSGGVSRRPEIDGKV